MRLNFLSIKKHKAFTIIELLIVIVIIGILSVLLFRTLAEMTYISGRIQFEKIIAKNLLTIHTTTNYLAEQYPHIDRTGYTNIPTNNGYITGLYLMSKDYKNRASLTVSGNTIYLKESQYPGTTIFINDKRISLTGIMFRILPIEHTVDINDLPPDQVNAEGFRMFGKIMSTSNTKRFNNISLNLQHFVHLKQ